MMLGLSVSSLIVDLGYFWVVWFFMLGHGLWIFFWIEMGCSGNIIISRRNWLLGHCMHCGRFFGVPFIGEYGRYEGRKMVESVSILCFGFG